MTPARWQQVKGALAGALERDDTGERAAFLSETCEGDPELAREVQSLLEQPPDEFDAFAETIGLINPDPLAENVRRRVGAYQLLRELGRGGMGTVWLAERADQEFTKRVAIKLLKRGTDTDEVLRRFRAERQILASLEHPNIARLLDAGTTDDGLPYFVMEYVVGARVTDFCFAQNLSLEERLRLFQKICGAVQFAHQNLVIHRDLKPANILITAEGEPKLLDFGIAKLVGPSESAFEVTLFEHQRLTPAYASPEQVRGDPVTTVSDVYALGALLYELLTARTAHRFARLEPNHTELMRVIVEGTPVRPSQVAPDAATQRRLRGDLDRIVLMALRKEPGRRYAGVGAFAEDIRRYLDDMPVRARPATLGYRAHKFISRNKTGVLAGALVLLALIGGSITTAVHARRAELEALHAQKEARRAERHFQSVRHLANSLLLEFQNAIKDLPGTLPARQLVTRRALEYLDRLAQEAGNDVPLKSELAAAYQRIGLVTFELPQAISSHRKAVALSEVIVTAAPNDTNYGEQLSASYGDLSDVLKISGHSAESIEYARKSLAIALQLVKDHPSDDQLERHLADRYLGLGLMLLDAGRATEARENLLHAMPLQEEVLAHDATNMETVRDLAAIYGTLSEALFENGELPAALDYSRRQMEMTQGIFRSDPSNTRSRRDMWSAHFRAARLRAAAGDSTAALGDYDKAIELMEGLSAADPADLGHRRWLARTYAAQADLFADLGQTDRALARYSQAITISDELFAADHDRVEARTDLIEMNLAAGRLLTKTGQATRALRHLQKAVSLAETAAQQDPENLRVRSLLAQVFAGMAGTLSSLSQGPGAQPNESYASSRAACDWYRRSADLWREMERNGTLRGIDAAWPAEVARALDECARPSQPR